MTALPPKPTHNFFPLRFAIPTAVSAEERRGMIEMEAYLRAEKRGFSPSDGIDDWLMAELDVDKRLVLNGVGGWLRRL